MKYQYASKFFSYLTLTMSIISFSLSASAAIVRTDMVFYDLATASQRSYAVSMLSTSEGAHISLHRHDDKLTLAIDMATCFNRQASTDQMGYISLKKRETQLTDPTLSSFLNFTQDNQLRVAKKLLPNAQSLLLDRDSLTVVVVEPAMITLDMAGCQR